jgi:hypothetical protein
MAVVEAASCAFSAALPPRMRCPCWPAAWALAAGEPPFSRVRPLRLPGMCSQRAVSLRWVEWAEARRASANRNRTDRSVVAASGEERACVGAVRRGI